MPHSLRFCLLAIFLISTSSPSLAQQNQSSSIPEKFISDASHVLGGTGHVLTSPLRWHGKDWAIFGSVLGGTFALSFLDEEINEVFLRNHSKTADKVSDVGIEYGEPATVVILTGSLYAVGLIADSEWLRESCVILSASLLPSGIIQTVTKKAAGRARPHLGLGHHEFDPFRNEEAYYAFFSGHTMVAMATSHVFAKRINNAPAKVVLYGLGGIAGLARMYNEDHWLTDVVLGNALAIVSVNSVSKWLEAKKNNKAMGGLQWRVIPARRGVSLSVAW
ncbi:phosphatase PAP2 family protein [candidate division KSB1 bacterium]|nr:phosphatase PAP2 family protein [candidate division KSB1 bacterium]